MRMRNAALHAAHAICDVCPEIRNRPELSVVASMFTAVVHEAIALEHNFCRPD